MKTIITAIACLLSVALSAQSNYNATLRTTALATSVVKLNKTSHTYQGNVLLNRLPAPAAHVHNSAYRAGVALLVLGPLKMAAGLGVLGWTAAHYRDINNDGGDLNKADRGVAFGAALGTFHLLTGAALTAGGAVLLRKSRTGSAYLTIPELTAPVSASGTGNGLGVRTSIIF